MYLYRLGGRSGPKRLQDFLPPLLAKERETERDCCYDAVPENNSLYSHLPPTKMTPDLSNYVSIVLNVWWMTVAA
jgi:hypothetical protein